MSKKTSQNGPNLRAWSILLYGAPKIGKTEQIARLPNPLILNCEPMGVESLRTSFDRWDIADLNELAADAAAIALEPNPVIILDGFTTLLNAACVTEGKGLRAGLESQQAYKRVMDKITPPLHALLRAGKIIGATGHARRIDDPEGIKDKVEIRPDVSPELGNDLFSLFSIIAYCYIPIRAGATGPRSMMLTKTNDNPQRRILAGDRFGILPETMPLDIDQLFGTLRDSFAPAQAAAPAQTTKAG